MIAIPGCGIKKFVIPGFPDPVSGLGLHIGRDFGIPIDLFYAQSPYEKYIRTVESDSDCQNTNLK